MAHDIRARTRRRLARTDEDARGMHCAPGGPRAGAGGRTEVLPVHSVDALAVHRARARRACSDCGGVCAPVLLR